MSEPLASQMARESANPAPPVRRRPATSCENCRSKKLRCDKLLPCGRCKRVRTNCTYRNDANSWRRTLQPVRSLPEHSSRPGDLAVEIQNLERIISQQQRLLASLDTQRPGQHFVPETLPLRNTPTKTRYYGPSHWISVAKEVPTPVGAFAYEDADFRVNNTDANTATVLQLSRDVRASRLAIKYSGSSELETLKLDLLEALPKDERDATSLIWEYVKTLNAIHRLVDDATIWHRLSHVYLFMSMKRLEDIDVPDAVFLILACAIGSTFHSEAYWRRQAALWIRLAQRSFEGPLEKPSYNIRYLECFCLLLLAKQTTPYCAGLTWLSGGALLSAAMTMGLHRDPRNFANLSPGDADRRRRLWACSLEIALQSSMDDSLPLLLNPDDFDTDAPDKFNDADLSYRSEALLQVELYRSVPLRLKVARFLTAARSNLKLDQAAELTEQLGECQRNIVAIASSFNSYEDFQVRFVDLLFHRYILLLNVPLMLHSRDFPPSLLPRKTCLASAKAIARYANQAPPTNRSAKVQTNRLPRLWAFGRGSFKGPLGLHVILVLALEYSRLMNKRHQRDVLDEFGKAGKESEDILSLLDGIQKQLRRAVDVGSASTKAFHFLGALLAQFKAQENVGNRYKHPLDSLKETLSTCMAAMQTVASADRATSDNAAKYPTNAIDELPLDLDSLFDNAMDWDLSALLNMPA